jgi:glycine hydroxymethyltransferase
MQGGPLMHVIAAKAVCFKEAMSPEFAAYQGQTVRNARALAARLAASGFRLVAGGTDTHLMLIDLTNKGITGKQAQAILDEVGIVVNKNMIPFDREKPFVASGIRIGTPAVTTRGMKEEEMERIADLIAAALLGPDGEATKQQVRAGVSKLCDAFPIDGGSS